MLFIGFGQVLLKSQFKACRRGFQCSGKYSKRLYALDPAGMRTAPILVDREHGAPGSRRSVDMEQLAPDHHLGRGRSHSGHVSNHCLCSHPEVPLAWLRKCELTILLEKQDNLKHYVFLTLMQTSSALHS